MRTTGVVRRKVNRAFRVTRRRPLSPREVSLSAAQAAAPVVALGTVSRAQPRGKGGAGIALATSLAIHVGAVLAYVFGGPVPHTVPEPGTVLVDILRSPQTASPTKNKPVARAVAPSPRPRNKVWLSAGGQPAPLLRRVAQRAADDPSAAPATLAAPAPESSPEAPPVVAAGTIPPRTRAVLPPTAAAPKPTAVAARATDATAGAEIARRLRLATASC